MNYAFLFVFIGLISLFGCSTSKDEPAILGDGGEPATSGEGGEPAISCRYDNRFAGPDCKEYLGSHWDDRALVEQDCGASFVEENAKVVEEACPDEMEIGAAMMRAKGVCHVGIGAETAYDVYSYDGPMDRLASACTVHLDGVFEVLVDDGTGATVHQPLPEALDALDSNDQVAVSSGCKDKDCLAEMIDRKETFDFVPKGVTPERGLIIYPAGNVDPRAYAPPAMALAEEGIFVSIVPMENYLPTNGYLHADLVRERNPQVQRWFVGGHGLGGTMATRYGATETGKTLLGLVLWSAVAGEVYDLGQSALKVLSVFGELDENYNAEQIQQFAHTLPEDTAYVCIKGGDYGQFGYYEDDSSVATISREKQQEQVLLSTGIFIENPGNIVSDDCQQE